MTNCFIYTFFFKKIILEKDVLRLKVVKSKVDTVYPTVRSVSKAHRKLKERRVKNGKENTLIILPHGIQK